MASAISSSIPSIISCTPSTIRTKCSTRSSIGQLKFPSKIAEALISDSPFGWSYTKCPLEGGPFSRVAQSRIRDLPIASATAASIQQTENSAESLVGSLLARVEGTDRGAMLSKEEHKKVAETVSQLEQFCIPEPLKSPLIFGEWDVEYCSNPTSTGGYYRSAIGRLLLKTKEMAQTIEAPDSVGNRVAFRAFNAIDGEVSLKGKRYLDSLLAF
eukprot:Gb_00384 [translate_table: standard]